MLASEFPKIRNLFQSSAYVSYSKHPDEESVLSPIFGDRCMGVGLQSCRIVPWQTRFFISALPTYK